MSNQIHRGTPEFRRTNLALFSAGFATFSLLYCVQPLMPVFAREFHVSAAQSSLSLSLTTGLLAPSMIVAGALSESRGRKPMMVASLLASALYLFFYYMGSSVAGSVGGLFWDDAQWAGVAAFAASMLFAGVLLAVVSARRMAAA